MISIEDPRIVATVNHRAINQDANQSILIKGGENDMALIIKIY